MRAAKGAGLAAGEVAGSSALFLLLGIGSLNPLEIAMGAIGIGLSPVAGLAGGIYGAIAAEPKEKVKQAEAALKKAFADVNVQAALRARML